MNTFRVRRGVLPFVPVALALTAGVATGTNRPKTRPERELSRPPAVAAPSIPPTPTNPDLTRLIELTRAIPRVALDNPSSEVLETWPKPLPNKGTYGDCGPSGSEGADVETNLRKNRTDLPTEYHAVTFDAITQLDYPDASTRRDHWTQAQLDVIEPYEGIAVTVTGFVAAFRPQAKNKESTNCDETGEGNTDWHIALVGEAGAKEADAVVVETTPRLKSHHSAWTPANFSALAKGQDSVRVSGYLLLDPVHKNHLGKFRQTLWEVHPIHRIEVFRNGRWVDLDDAQ